MTKRKPHHTTARNNVDATDHYQPKYPPEYGVQKEPEQKFSDFKELYLYMAGSFLAGVACTALVFYLAT